MRTALFLLGDKKCLHHSHLFNQPIQQGIVERQTNMMGRMEWTKGQVISFDRDKGYGYIEGEDGERFFAESVDINMDLEVLVPGQLVNFRIKEGNPERERMATNITIDF